MTPTILGLDIGGANLKAATVDQRAVSVPFQLWKQPHELPNALADLVARFPDAEEFAVTMTGELCDCFETKREGVETILQAVETATNGRRVRIWSTNGIFYKLDTARRLPLSVAASNWHALAAFVGNSVPGDETGQTLLIDIGSTTTDIIPIIAGFPETVGMTDMERLASGELVYVGIRRTPLFGILGFEGAAELFATTLDAYLLLGMLAEEDTDTDTADGRPATRTYAHARIARMKCADVESMSREQATALALDVHRRIVSRLFEAVQEVILRNRARSSREEESSFRIVTSGGGEFVAREVAGMLPSEVYGVVSLADTFGPDVSACAPAYAVAVMATEQ